MSLLADLDQRFQSLTNRRQQGLNTTPTVSRLNNYTHSPHPTTSVATSPMRILHSHEERSYTPVAERTILIGDGSGYSNPYTSATGRSGSVTTVVEQNGYIVHKELVDDDQYMTADGNFVDNMDSYDSRGQVIYAPTFGPAAYRRSASTVSAIEEKVIQHTVITSKLGEVPRAFSSSPMPFGNRVSAIPLSGAMSPPSRYTATAPGTANTSLSPHRLAGKDVTAGQSTNRSMPIVDNFEQQNHPYGRTALLDGTSHHTTPTRSSQRRQHMPNVAADPFPSFYKGAHQGDRPYQHNTVQSSNVVAHTLVPSGPRAPLTDTLARRFGVVTGEQSYRGTKDRPSQWFASSQTHAALPPNGALPVRTGPKLVQSYVEAPPPPTALLMAVRNKVPADPFSKDHYSISLFEAESDAERADLIFPASAHPTLQTVAPFNGLLIPMPQHLVGICGASTPFDEALRHTTAAAARNATQAAPSSTRGGSDITLLQQIVLACRACKGDSSRATPLSPHTSLEEAFHRVLRAGSSMALYSTRGAPILRHVRVDMMKATDGSTEPTIVWSRHKSSTSVSGTVPLWQILEVSTSTAQCPALERYFATMAEDVPNRRIGRGSGRGLVGPRLGGTKPAILPAGNVIRMLFAGGLELVWVALEDSSAEAWVSALHYIAVESA